MNFLISHREERITGELWFHSYRFAAISEKICGKQSSTSQATAAYREQQIVKFVGHLIENFFSASCLTLYQLIIIISVN